MVIGRDPASDPPAAVPSRIELGRLPCEVLHPGSATKSAVYVVTSGGSRMLVKDVRPQRGLVRVVYGRRVLRREERALAHLAGTPGVPRLLGRVDRDAIAMQFIEGETLNRRLGPDRLRAACGNLARRVAGLHARGVVHLDLRQKRNVLVDPGGEVFLLDYQSALVLGDRGWRGALLRWLKRFDESAALKYRARYVPELLTPDERRRARRSRLLGRLWVFHRFGPFLRFLLGKRRMRSP